jgi:site-specific DNA-cytosine methylase
MNKIKNVLSLFDGISCGQIALNRVGIKYDNYFASEIDKYAIKVTQANYPNTIQLGDITKVKGSDLPNIELLFGGSPCNLFQVLVIEKVLTVKVVCFGNILEF